MTEKIEVIERRRNAQLLNKINISVLIALTGFTGYIAKEQVAQGKEIATIQANRFTASDGMKVWETIGDIKEVIAAFPKTIPPVWFLNDVNNLKKEMNEELKGIRKELIEIKLELERFKGNDVRQNRENS